MTEEMSIPDPAPGAKAEDWTFDQLLVQYKRLYQITGALQSTSATISKALTEPVDLPPEAQ